MRLENGIISITFDDTSGCVVSLRDLRTGQEHLPDRAHADLFRLIVPELKWQSRYADASAQTCRFEEQPAALRLHYDSLLLSDGARVPIEVTVVAELPAGSDEVYLSLSLNNRSDLPVAEVCFPKLGGWTG